MWKFAILATALMRESFALSSSKLATDQFPGTYQDPFSPPAAPAAATSTGDENDEDDEELDPSKYRENRIKKIGSERKASTTNESVQSDWPSQKTKGYKRGRNNLERILSL